MSEQIKDKKPAIVVLLGGVYLIGAIIGLLRLFPAVETLLGIRTHMTMTLSQFEYFKTVITIIVLFVSGYGFLSLKKWGYWLVILFNMTSIAITMVLLLLGKQELYQVDIIVSVMFLCFAIPTKRYFYNEKISQ